MNNDNFIRYRVLVDGRKFRVTAEYTHGSFWIRNENGQFKHWRTRKSAEKWIEEQLKLRGMNK